LRFVEQRLTYLGVGALSSLVVIILERLAMGLEGSMLTTEIYSIHGFSHIFFGIGLASIILFLRPTLSAKFVIVAVLLVGIGWELHEGSWLGGEAIDSLEDIVLAILSASTFLCFMRGIDSARPDSDPPSLPLNLFGCRFSRATSLACWLLKNDVIWAIEDGRLDRIIDEHLRYMKETDGEIWAL